MLRCAIPYYPKSTLLYGFSQVCHRLDRAFKFGVPHTDILQGMGIACGDAGQTKPLCKIDRYTLFAWRQITASHFDGVERHGSDAPAKAHAVSGGMSSDAGCAHSLEVVECLLGFGLKWLEERSGLGLESIDQDIAVPGAEFETRQQKKTGLPGLFGQFIQFVLTPLIMVFRYDNAAQACPKRPAYQVMLINPAASGVAPRVEVNVES